MNIKRLFYMIKLLHAPVNGLHRFLQYKQPQCLLKYWVELRWSQLWSRLPKKYIFKLKIFLISLSVGAPMKLSMILPADFLFQAKELTFVLMGIIIYSYLAFSTVQISFAIRMKPATPFSETQVMLLINATQQWLNSKMNAEFIKFHSLTNIIGYNDHRLW